MKCSTGDATLSFQDSYYSLVLKSIISLSTFFLIGLILAYHAVEIQVNTDQYGATCYIKVYMYDVYILLAVSVHPRKLGILLFKIGIVDLAIIIIKHKIIGPIAKLLSLNHGNHAGFLITIMRLDLLSTFGLLNFCRWLFIRIKLHCFNTVEIPSCL